MSIWKPRETDFPPEEEWAAPVLGVAHADLKDLLEDVKQRKAKVDIPERKLWLNIKNTSEN